MSWLYYFIVGVLCLAAGVGIGVGIEKLGQFLYWKRIANGTGGGNTVLKKGINFANGEVVAGGIDAVFIGDSITEGYNVKKYFSDLSVENRGISADHSAGVYNRIIPNIGYLKPRNIVLLIGINDIMEGMSETSIVGNIKNILDVVARELPTANMLVESIYPSNEMMSHTFAGCDTNRTIDSINQKLCAECERRGIGFIDVNSKLKDSNGLFRTIYTKDGVHATEAGYAVITKTIRPFLKLTKPLPKAEEDNK